MDFLHQMRFRSMGTSFINTSDTVTDDSPNHTTNKTQDESEEEKSTSISDENEVKRITSVRNKSKRVRGSPGLKTPTNDKDEVKKRTIRTKEKRITPICPIDAVEDPQFDLSIEKTSQSEIEKKFKPAETKEEKITPIPPKGEITPVPTKEEITPIPPKEKITQVPTKEEITPIPPKEKITPVPTKEEITPIPPKGEITPIPTKEEVTPIPAKDEDLQAAKEIRKCFPKLTEIFSGYDRIAVKLDETVNMKTVDIDWHEEFSFKLQWPYFTHQNQTDRQAMGDYLARINIPELFYKFYSQLMKSLELDYCTEDLLKEKKLMPQTPILFSIRGNVWNYSDSSLLFGERVASTGIFKFYFLDLQAMKNLPDTEETGYFFESAMGAIHNCSRNPANRHVFHKLNMVPEIIPFLKSASPKVKMIVLLTLSHIVTEEENYLLLADVNIFTFMLFYLTSAWTMSAHRYNGFSAEELVSGLMGLAKNDENKKVLMEIGSLPVLTAIMKNGLDAEKKPAVECVWELAFNKENQKIILAEKEIMKLLKSLLKSEDKGIARAAEGALWVLHAEKRERKLKKHKRRTVEEKKGAGHIMLSYAWTEQKTVLQVKENLKRSEFRVWMDVDDMGGSTLQAMAEAVEKSAVVLVCMSEQYKQSQNCRNEAEYAFSLKKDIIPLILERGYKPDGWLGMIKGTKLFFDFSGKYPFETKIGHLIKEIGARGKTFPEEDAVDAGELAVVKASPLEMGKGSTVAEWNKDDVKVWLQKNSVTLNSALEGMNGEQLKFLHTLSHRAPEFYFGYLEKNLGLNNLEDLMKFSEAIDQL